MAQTLQNAMAQIRRWAGGGRDTSDARLLERFARTGDEDAFAELVQRHGSMVLSVCRRVLTNHQDAEDAFQATFLVLARKADSQAWTETVGPWLHGVALRIALKARTARLRRAVRENQPQQPRRETNEEALLDLRRALDEELERLPSRYRSPLVLCYLEGKTRDEAAEELGWSVGSVKGRLERGREVLKQRLLRRGLTLSGVLCAGFLDESTASASVPAPLAAAAVQASVQFASPVVPISMLSPGIVQLAQGVLHTMLIEKLKTAFFTVALTGFLSLGGAWFYETSFAQERRDGEKPAAERREGDKPAAEKRRDGDKAPEVRRDGDKPNPEVRRDGDRPKEGEKEDPNAFRLRDGDPVAVIKEIDVAKGTIKLQVGREEGVQTFSLPNKELKVSNPYGRDWKVADVPLESRIGFRLQGTEVTAVYVLLPMLNVTLEKIDVEGRIAHILEGREARKMTILPDARITMGKEPVKLSSLRGNQRAKVTTSPDKKEIVSMIVFGVGGAEGERPREGGDQPREGGERRPDGVGNRQFGVITDVDQAKGSLTVLVGREPDLSIKTFELAKDAKVQVLVDERNPTEVSASFLAKATPAMFTLSNDGKTVQTIQLKAPMIRGKIKSVDAAGRKLTLSMEREEKSFELAKDSKTNLADLKEGDFAAVILTLDRSQVLEVKPFRRDGER